MTSRSVAFGGLVAVLAAGLTLGAQAQRGGRLGGLGRHHAVPPAERQRPVPVQKQHEPAPVTHLDKTTTAATAANTAARTAADTVTTVPGTETVVERAGNGPGIRPARLWKLEGALRQLQVAREGLVTAHNPVVAPSPSIEAHNSRAVALIDQALAEITASITEDGGIPVERPVVERIRGVNPAPRAVTGTPGTATVHKTDNPIANPATPVSQTGHKTAPNPRRR